MDDTLRLILERELNDYAGKTLNGETYLSKSLDGQRYTVTSIASLGDDRFVNVGLIVRLDDDHIIIEHDNNNKPLVEALTQACVPREKIVIDYDAAPQPAMSV
ncbi:MAG: element excision factor XisI family protein [Chloroflexota bacterium]|nr:element excision factor XisI family protein [Chloroflexota bacterium]